MLRPSPRNRRLEFVERDGLAHMRERRRTDPQSRSRSRRRVRCCQDRFDLDDRALGSIKPPSDPTTASKPNPIAATAHDSIECERAREKRWRPMRRREGFCVFELPLRRDDKKARGAERKKANYDSVLRPKDESYMSLHPLTKGVYGASCGRRPLLVREVDPRKQSSSVQVFKYTRICRLILSLLRCALGSTN